MNTLGERLYILRKSELKLTMEKFGERLGVKKNTVSQWESGTNNLPEQMLNAICLVNWDGKFVNKDWLANGEGDIFNVPDDETADLVSDLLEEPDNEFYHSILELVRTYKQLSPESRETLREFGKMYLENMKNRKN